MFNSDVWELHWMELFFTLNFKWISHITGNFLLCLFFLSMRSIIFCWTQWVTWPPLCACVLGYESGAPHPTGSALASLKGSVQLLSLCARASRPPLGLMPIPGFLLSWGLCTAHPHRQGQMRAEKLFTAGTRCHPRVVAGIWSGAASHLKAVQEIV